MQSTRCVERIAQQSTRVGRVRGADCKRDRHAAWSGLHSNRHAWSGCVERIARQSTRCVERIARQSTREMWERPPRAAERAAGEQPSDRAGVVFSRAHAAPGLRVTGSRCASPAHGVPSAGWVQYAKEENVWDTHVGRCMPEAECFVGTSVNVWSTLTGDLVQSFWARSTCTGQLPRVAV